MLFTLLLQLDTQLFTWINNLPHSGFGDFLLSIIRYGTRGGIVYIPLLVFLLLSARYRNRIIIFIASYLSTIVIADLILKLIVRRIRPFDAFSVSHLLQPLPTSFSFPSGETAMAFTIALVCTSTFESKWWRLLWAWALFVALVRIYMGHHYPSDVLAGALLGLSITKIILIISNKIILKQKSAL